MFLQDLHVRADFRFGVGVRVEDDVRVGGAFPEAFTSQGPFSSKGALSNREDVRVRKDFPSGFDK